MLIKDIIENFWFDCDYQEKTKEEHLRELHEVGLEPEFMMIRIQDMIAEYKKKHFNG
jgi:hypothetical protein